MVCKEKYTNLGLEDYITAN